MMHARRNPPRRLCRGFTLIELMVVVALIAIILTLAAPSFTEFIRLQRLKSINAQVVTDMQYARSEAVSRGVPVQVWFREADNATPMSCYILFTSSEANPRQQCDCRLPEGLRCADPAKSREVRTVEVPTSLSVRVNAVAAQEQDFAFDPRNGGIFIRPPDFIGELPTPFALETYIDAAHKFRDTVSLSGKVKVCIPAGSTLSGAAC